MGACVGAGVGEDCGAGESLPKQAAVAKSRRAGRRRMV
jgi:hypothetical protein